MSSHSKHSTAIHEAGHAVAHFRLEIGQANVSIVSDGQLAGYSRADSSVTDNQEAEAQVVAYCAGYAACLAANISDAAAGCGDDFRLAQALIDHWQLDSLGDFQSKAVELMSRPENIRAVALIAEHLLRWERLDVDYMDMLLDVADGNMSPAEFDRWFNVWSRHNPQYAKS